MPYITQEERDDLHINGWPDKLSSGKLNYCITNLLVATKPRTYNDYNALVGVLECCKLEFYSKAVSAYEAEKERVNGDVYPLASPVNLAWAGGFFEGEGCFYAHYGHPREDGSKVYRTQASLSQKDEGLLKQFQGVVRFGVVYPCTNDGLFVWKTSKNGEARQLFDLLRPYLGERRQGRFLELDAGELGQVFRPPKPPRTHCTKGHDLDVVGRRAGGVCAECDRAYKRVWYHSNKEKVQI